MEASIKDMPRPDLEAIVAGRLKEHAMSPELIVAFSRMLSEWEFHWWTQGRELGRSENLSSFVRKALSS
jgi:hypothetical protein